MNRDVLLTSCAPALWGSTYVVALYWLPQGVPFLNASIRMLPVGFMLLIAHPRSALIPWSLPLVSLAVLNIVVFQASLFFAVSQLPGGIVATLLATAALIGLLLNHLLLKRVPSLASCGATIAGIVGVSMITVDLRGLESMDWAEVKLGVAVALLGATSVAVGTVLTSRWLKHGSTVLRGSSECLNSPMAFTAKQLVAGGAVLAILAVVFEDPISTLPSLAGAELAGYAYLALPGTLLAYSLWFRGVSRLGARIPLMLRLLSPVVASALDFVSPLFLDAPKFGQGLTLRRGLGTAVVLGAILVIGLQSNHNRRFAARGVA